jgi:hypothetical protein
MLKARPTRRLPWPAASPLQPVRAPQWRQQRPSYADARPVLINAALARAQQRPSGNWFVLAASGDIRTDRPHSATIAGTEVVAWRDTDRRLTVAPGACPHLGAPLSLATVDCGALVCRWHGLRLTADGRPGWRPFPSHDDGVLVWVRLDRAGGESPSPAPVLPPRPPLANSVTAVTRVEGVCDPADVVANRLDPWHGSWLHPYSFARLEVVHTPPPTAIADAEDRFVVSVTFRVAGGLGVPVIAEFSCPEPRTVVMHIVEGEGVGSLVETHATPLSCGPDGRPRTAVTEAVLAYSGRSGFGAALAMRPLLRPLIRRVASRLWRDDLAYAERRYTLRSSAPVHPTGTSRPDTASP